MCSTTTAALPPVFETELPPKEPLGVNTLLSSCFYDNDLQVSLDLGSVVTDTKAEFSGTTTETNWLPLEVNTAISLCVGPETTVSGLTKTTGNRNVFDDLFGNTSQNENSLLGFENISIEDLLNNTVWTDN